MNQASVKFLQELVAAASPSGFEQPAMKIWREYASRFADRVDRDIHGNSIAICNPDGRPRLMFAGHCDELGFLVSYINDKGFIYFKTIGGHDRAIIPGRRVVIYGKSGPVVGVTGKKAIHMMTAEERKKVPEIENLWIDIGAESKEAAEKLVAVGDPAVYDMGFQKINDRLATSRGFDDKVGAFAVVEALRLLKATELSAAVYAVATVQEEIGIRGARTSSHAIDPLVGVAVDVTHATDHPEVDQRKEGSVKLGGGPVITRGANANPRVVELLIRAAEEEKINYQFQSIAGGTPTDANAMQVSRDGVAAGLVSIPLRYMHTPSEIVSLEDIENTARLLAKFATLVHEDIDFRP